MRPEDIRAYVDRDWEAIGELKERFWLEQQRRAGVAGALQVADELRRHVVALQTGWPTPEEREEDMAVHVRVAAVLQRAGRARRN